MQRSINISNAIVKAKQRDVVCQVCGAIPIDGAHFVPRNNPLPGNNPANPDSIVGLCRKHHQEYDKNKTHEDRIKWLDKHDINNAYLRNLYYGRFETVRQHNKGTPIPKIQGMVEVDDSVSKKSK